VFKAVHGSVRHFALVLGFAVNFLRHVCVRRQRAHRAASRSECVNQSAHLGGRGGFGGLGGGGLGGRGGCGGLGGRGGCGGRGGGGGLQVFRIGFYIQGNVWVDAGGEPFWVQRLLVTGCACCELCISSDSTCFSEDTRRQSSPESPGNEAGATGHGHKDGD